MRLGSGAYLDVVLFSLVANDPEVLGKIGVHGKEVGGHRWVFKFFFGV